jgi:hypothetical protein
MDESSNTGLEAWRHEKLTTGFADKILQGETSTGLQARPNDQADTSR